MRNLFGIILILAGVIVGLYFGIWWAFIGGIIGLIEQVKADDLNSLAVAFSVARILFAATIGGVAALVAVLPGLAMLKD